MNDADPVSRILDMLADGRINAGEAKSLLALVSGAVASGTSKREPEGRRRGRSPDRGRFTGAYFHIRVDPRVESGADPNADRVNIRVPIGLIKAGARLTSLIPGAAADRVNEMLSDRGIDLDFKKLDADRLEAILAEGGFMIDITEGDCRIRISVE